MLSIQHPNRKHQASPPIRLFSPRPVFGRPNEGRNYHIYMELFELIFSERTLTGGRDNRLYSHLYEAFLSTAMLP